VEIGDARGRRIATLHGDQAFAADVLLPAGGDLYVRAGEREARFRPDGGKVVEFESLSFANATSRARSALEDAFRRGLFAAPFGRHYYDGVVDQSPALSPVDFSDSSGAPEPYFGALPSRGPRFVLGGGISTGVAGEVPLLRGVTAGVRPGGASGPALSLDVLTASDGPLREWRIELGGGWLWSVGKGKVRGWGGFLASGGWLHQELSEGPDLDSAALLLGPSLGLSTDVAGAFGIWSELTFAGMLHQRDDETTLSFAPSAWLGASLRL
jgi:hypothetical protein